MYISVNYNKHSGKLQSVAKLSSPQIAHSENTYAESNIVEGIVLKASEPIVNLHPREIKNSFRVADVPKEGFVVLERIKDA